MIIPARNEEASIARAVESVAAQAEVGEVIVVNDQSTDRTGEILSELASRISKLRVLVTDDLPHGWIGKNYAATLGAAAARGDWLLFTDADTYHRIGSTRRALADAVDHDVVMVSYSPEQEMESFWERVLIPFVYCRLAARFSFARVNDPAAPDAAANGQFLLVLRDAYEAVGGHAAIAGQVLEDVALARLLKQNGFGIYFTAPIGIVHTRMYRDFQGMWQGWTKNLYPLMGGTPRATAIELAETCPVFEAFTFVLMGALVIERRAESPWLLLLIGLAALCGAHVRYAAALYRNLYPISYIQYYALGVCLYSAALVASWWKNTRGAVVWKGRAYPARIQRGSS
ncbi:MAG TPA: glycosyltransferase family 2 protein [Candidatus Polarisedimenticolia bacterium]|nr:glycosyltransferase family 2 protein [Candidatus Polarisedimenticolia bacterium]